MDHEDRLNGIEWPAFARGAALVGALALAALLVLAWAL
jgi:hypothetical protein